MALNHILCDMVQGFFYFVILFHINSQMTLYSKLLMKYMKTMITLIKRIPKNS